MNSSITMDSSHDETTKDENSVTINEGAHEPGGYGSTRQLFIDLRDYLAQHPALDQNSTLKLAYFLLAVLFPECAPMWPFASIVSSDVASSPTLLRMLDVLLPTSLHVGEVTIAGRLTLPQSPGRVLIVDQLAPTNQLLRLLRSMSRLGAGVLQKGEIHKICCPVVTCTVDPLRDPSLTEQAIQIVLMPTRGIATLLGCSIVGDVDLQRGVIPLLEEQDQDTRVRRSNSPQAVAVDAGLFVCHEPHRKQARVGEFATLINGILIDREEILEFEPRAVGDILRSIGLFTQRLGRAGRGIRLSNEIRRKSHELAFAHHVCSIQDGIDRCEFCTEARVRFGKARK